ncbi:ArsR/SmtB family transcription factor [Roseovarius sp.]|uniref:ArsR/SmtB family transcription factor n=1 Tax=Roseovarius sp. TaxID=1486281 RepID=UPI003B5CEA87
MTDVFHALADPTRRDLLDRLFLKGGLTLSELAEGAPMTRQGVAKHIAILEAANLVTAEWEGRNKRHFLNPVPLTGIVHRWVGKFEDARLDALAEFKTRLEDPTDMDKKDTKRHG